MCQKPLLTTTKDLKQRLNEKRGILQENKQKVGELEKQFRSKAKITRLEYNNKIEEQFKSTNARDAWKGLSAMLGRNTQQQQVKWLDAVKFVNEMNTFYARFDDNDFRNECDDLCQSPDPLPVTVCKTMLFLSCYMSTIGRLHSQII